MESENTSPAKVNEEKNSIQAFEGRLAEAIVEEIFLKIGYVYFRFGTETPLLNGVPTTQTPDGTSQIKEGKCPIYNRKGFTGCNRGSQHRTNSEFDIYDYPRSRGKYQYANAYFILVNQKHIKVQTAENLKRSENIIYLKIIRILQPIKIFPSVHRVCKKFFVNC